MGTTPAGWYPESAGGRVRWWNGSAWTTFYADEHLGAPGAREALAQAQQAQAPGQEVRPSPYGQPTDASRRSPSPYAPPPRARSSFERQGWGTAIALIAISFTSLLLILLVV